MVKLKFQNKKSFIKKQFLLLFILTQSLIALCQAPPEEFFEGLNLLSIDKTKAKTEFLAVLKKDTLFHGTYHFLGVIHLYENQLDSAILNFKKSIRLNTGNVNHTQEMTYVRLIDTYLYLHDFHNSFSVAWNAYLKYPNNQAIESGLKDVCLWSFHIEHNNLDSSYLSAEIKDEYVVNSVPEEYLIIRKIRVNDQYLIVNGQSLIKKKKVNYDILNCSTSDGKEQIDIKFKLNWDLDKDFGGKTANTDQIISDIDIPSHERIGALLVSDSEINLKKEIKSMLKKDRK